MDIKEATRCRVRQAQERVLLGERVANCMAAENETDLRMREYFIQDRALRAKTLRMRKAWY